ncbi:MAG: DUF4105 domain-containing protein, partial [Flavobacteriaceae bacterium]|nr:DUF4105 domain-containing protein [Flavobacteriaceae bacterium]
MSKYILSLFCALSIYMLPAQMQQLSSTFEISVLTIAPGTSLNDAFGHSAFRVKDDTKDLDIVFNYGVYDFDTPNFYTKFAQGKLNYRLAANPFKAFFNSYKAQNRSITEQVLNLSQSEKQNLFNALLENYKPENQYYLYDFFYNNCATKIKDVLNEALNGDIIFNLPENFESKTFRSLIYEKVNSNSWGSLGIDIALGSVIDKTATPEEHMFLPQFIHDFFAVATYNNQTLIKQEYILFENKNKGTHAN